MCHETIVGVEGAKVVNIPCRWELTPDMCSLKFPEWGEMVFTTSDPADCWDGSHNNRIPNINTFYYYYEVKTEVCGEYSGKGSVLVLQ